MNAIEQVALNKAISFSQSTDDDDYNDYYDDYMERIIFATTVHEFGHTFGLDDRGTDSYPNSIMKKGLPYGLFDLNDEEPEKWKQIASPKLVDFVGAHFPDIDAEDNSN